MHGFCGADFTNYNIEIHQYKLWLTIISDHISLANQSHLVGCIANPSIMCIELQIKVPRLTCRKLIRQGENVNVL